jgi:hypothetical protein
MNLVGQLIGDHTPRTCHRLCYQRDAMQRSWHPARTARYTMYCCCSLHRWVQPFSLQERIACTRLMKRIYVGRIGSSPRDHSLRHVIDNLNNELFFRYCLIFQCLKCKISFQWCTYTVVFVFQIITNRLLFISLNLTLSFFICIWD